MTVEEVGRELSMEAATGLDPAEVERRRARYGPNKLAEAKKEPGCAPDVLLARSVTARGADGRPMPIELGRERVLAANDGLARDGLRVLAVASRDLDPAAFDPDGDLLDEVRDLTLLALVGIVDPPRKEARDAIARCKEAGIRVRMITGDHATTAAAIGATLGIADEPAMGDLPARPDRATWPTGAREAHRPPNRPAARRASQTTSVIQLAAISHPAMTSVVQ
jgi:magnesium-transporting ATPase (P-type)